MNALIPLHMAFHALNKAREHSVHFEQKKVIRSPAFTMVIVHKIPRFLYNWKMDWKDKILIGLLLINMAVTIVLDSVVYASLRKSIEKHERAYRYGCADDWLDHHVRGNKKLIWEPYLD